ncbi:MarR family winged helix-turn-helix transcriptional regulator [Parasphingorhabdus sp.]|jgi:DNA-binding MarR family transcriptional regulator|uniref:MarR family winged helix-turn-helix transcriptional regulator n=1 Tax=Parasphingorhabdus sp. TaxID=2709688 RepID=UPI003D2C65D9
MEAPEEILNDVIDRCAAVRILSAARTVGRCYDDALRAENLTITQFTLLTTIGKAKPSSISEIGHYLSIDRTTVTRNLKLLEKAALITRGAEGPHRMREIRLTKQGVAALERAYPRWRSAQKLIENKFPDAKLEELMKALYFLNGMD